MAAAPSSSTVPDIELSVTKFKSTLFASSSKGQRCQSLILIQGDSRYARSAAMAARRLIQ